MEDRYWKGILWWGWFGKGWCHAEFWHSSGGTVGVGGCLLIPNLGSSASRMSPGELVTGSLKLRLPSGNARDLQRGCRTAVGTGPWWGSRRSCQRVSVTWLEVPNSGSLRGPVKRKPEPARREATPTSQELQSRGVAHKGALSTPPGQKPTVNSCHPEGTMPSRPGSRKNFMHPLPFLLSAPPQQRALLLGEQRVGWRRTSLLEGRGRSWGSGDCFDKLRDLAITQTGAF